MKKLCEKPGVVTEVLRHSRHEQLNQLQLIKGYTELGNSERVIALIDEMVFQARQETNMSNLKLLQTGELFMTFNWGIHQYRMEYEVLAQRSEYACKDELIYQWCAAFFQVVDVYADLIDENILSITIDTKEEDLCFIFDFSGKLKDVNGIRNYVGKVVEGLEIHMYECSSHVFSIEMRIKR